jgi:hypothetical protein
MKRIAAVQSILLLALSLCAQGQESRAGATNAVVKFQPAKPEATSTSVSAATNVVEVRSEAESLFEGRSLNLYGIGPGWKASTTETTVTGPLVEPFLAPRASDVPGRLLNLFNPLAPMQPPPETLHRSNVRGLSSRGWASVVGWRPGRSEFAEVTTHEPSSALLTIQCSKEESQR